MIDVTQLPDVSVDDEVVIIGAQGGERIRPEDVVRKCCERARVVIVPEMNLGQLALLLRAKYLVDVTSHTAVRGLPFRSSELAEVIVAATKELSK